MNFDLDDALESDDSFFEEPTALNKRASLTKTTEKLFGLAEKNTNKNEPTENVSKSRSSVTFDDTFAKTQTPPKPKVQPDWLDVPDSNDVLEKPTRKADFLDDLLSVRPKTANPEKKAASLEDILKESKVGTAPKTSTSLKEINTASGATADFGLLATTSRERRRMRRGSSTGIQDNLGLFGGEYQSGDFFSKDKKEADEVPIKTKKDSGMPDWLGSSVTTASKLENVAPEKSEKPAKENVETIDENSTKEIKKPIPQTEIIKDDFLKPQHINMEIQNTYSSLHQQESLLLVSMQLKKYEDSLKDIKSQQQEIIGKQDEQFKTLIDEYILKQQMVENNIRLQQERINNQIQMLISNPSGSQSVANSGESDRSREHNEESESIIRNMKQRHNEEMFIMEESYKKQFDLLEKSTEALEQRLKQDITNMSDSFEEKLSAIKEKYNEEVTYYKEKLKMVELQHAGEIKTLKDNHARIIDELKQEHSTQIEYLKELKQRELDLFNDGQLLSQKLDSGVQLLTNNTKVLHDMEEKAVQNYDVLTLARENSIQLKEKEIILMRNSLEKCREAAESERTQLLALVRNLENKIAEQSVNSREDRWALQQASASLTARTAALDRETEYNRTIVEREREQLKTLKESLLAEQEKMIMQLTEEKLLISSEKARIETSSKITSTYETEKIKAEAQTAIQVAKELTEKVTEEKARLQRQKHELETLRRNLAERESEFEEKETVLGFMMDDEQRKLKDHKRALAEARRMEATYKERLQQLHNKLVLVSNREKKLEEEQISLSKERLTLYTSMKTQKTCALCKADESFMLLNTQDDHMNTIPDPETLRYRLDMIEDERDSEVSKEESNSVHPNDTKK